MKKLIIMLTLIIVSFNVLAISEEKLERIKSFNSNLSQVSVLHRSLGINGITVPDKLIMKYAPSAASVRLTVYGYEVALVQEFIFSGLYGIRATFKDGNDWVYLTEPDYYQTTLDTKVNTDKVFNAAISIINQAAYDILRPDDGGVVIVPEFGIDRIDYLLGKLTVVSDELIVNE